MASRRAKQASKHNYAHFDAMKSHWYGARSGEKLQFLFLKYYSNTQVP